LGMFVSVKIWDCLGNRLRAGPAVLKALTVASQTLGPCTLILPDLRAIHRVSLSLREIIIGCRRSLERLSAIRDFDRICTRHVQTMWATQYPTNIGLRSGTSLFIFSYVHIRLPPLSAARSCWCRLFFDIFFNFSNGTSLLTAARGPTLSRVVGRYIGTGMIRLIQQF